MTGIEILTRPLNETFGYPGDNYFTADAAYIPSRMDQTTEGFGRPTLGETTQTAGPSAHKVSRRSPVPPERIQRASAAVSFDPLYPNEVMRKLAQYAEKISRVLPATSDVSCLSGFDILSPELGFLDDDHKDFFTGFTLKVLH